MEEIIYVFSIISIWTSEFIILREYSAVHYIKVVSDYRISSLPLEVMRDLGKEVEVRDEWRIW
jgi:hypothetical protein